MTQSIVKKNLVCGLDDKKFNGSRLVQALSALSWSSAFSLELGQQVVMMPWPIPFVNELKRGLSQLRSHARDGKSQPTRSLYQLLPLKYFVVFVTAFFNFWLLAVALFFRRSGCFLSRENRGILSKVKSRVNYRGCISRRYEITCRSSFFLSSFVGTVSVSR